MEKVLAVVASLAVFITWEAVRPFFAYGKGHWYRAGANALVGVTNTVLGRILFAWVYAQAFFALSSGRVGLLGLFDLPTWAGIALTILLLDLWSYWWHRFNHTIPFLWRFHRAHHTDTEMGATSAYRFHPVEIIFSSVLRLPLILLLGLKPQGLLLYESILTVSIAFHHANIGIGARADAALRSVIVSPVMHKLHHSVKPAEFSSNYSSILSVWDRIFDTWTTTEKPEDIRLGLNIYRDHWWQGYRGIMLTPFRSNASIPGTSKGNGS
jgi:sterol desaturase/sphingolipid hydroxylase (fatty acid hydroxylase superfamily)